MREYESDELATDSDDEKRLLKAEKAAEKAAEKRAAKKRKTAQAKTQRGANPGAAGGHFPRPYNGVQT